MGVSAPVGVAHSPGGLALQSPWWQLLVGSLFVRDTAMDVERLPLNAKDGAPPPGASITDSVFILMNAVLGAGVLGLPYCFRTCGLVGATVLLLISCITCFESMKILIICAQRCGCWSYEDIGDRAFGIAGRRWVDFCIILFELGSLVAFVNILADIMSGVAGTIVPPGAEEHRNLFMAALVTFVLLPLSATVKDAQLLAPVSMLSVGIVAVLSVVILVKAMAVPDDDGATPLALYRQGGILVAFPVILFSFTAHTALFPIYSTLRTPSLTRITVVVSKGLIWSFACYLAIGALGYAAFREKTSGDVLRNFGSSFYEGGLTFALKVGYGASVLCTVPICIIPLRQSILSVLHTSSSPVTPSVSSGPSSPSTSPSHGHVGTGGGSVYTIEFVAVTLAILLCVLLVAAHVPNVELVLGLAGATASMLLGYIMPSIFYLRLHSLPIVPWELETSVLLLKPRPSPVASTHHPTHARTARIMLAFGIMAMIFCTTATLIAVDEEAQVVALAKTIAVSEAADEDAAAKMGMAQVAVTSLAAVEKEVDDEVQREAVKVEEEEAAEVSEAAKRKDGKGEAAAGPVASLTDKTQAMLALNSTREAVKQEAATTQQLLTQATAKLDAAKTVMQTVATLSSPKPPPPVNGTAAPPQTSVTAASSLSPMATLAPPPPPAPAVSQPINHTAAIEAELAPVLGGNATLTEKAMAVVAVATAATKAAEQAVDMAVTANAKVAAAVVDASSGVRERASAIAKELSANTKAASVASQQLTAVQSGTLLDTQPNNTTSGSDNTAAVSSNTAAAVDVVVSVEAAAEALTDAELNGRR
eukprot:jgi/Chlat1/4323/Chrsp29S04486